MAGFVGGLPGAAGGAAFNGADAAFQAVKGVQEDAAAALNALAQRATGPIRTTVQGASGNLWIRLQGIRIPLGERPDLAPGRAVLIEVRPGPEGPTLRVMPATSSVAAGSMPDAGAAAAHPSAAGSPVGSAVVQLLQQFAAMARPDVLQRLLPLGLGLSVDVVRPLVRLLGAPQGFGDDLAAIREGIAQRVAAGTLSADESAALLRLLGEADAPDDAAGFGQRVLWASRQSPGRLEALLAQALERGRAGAGALGELEDLRSRLVELRGRLGAYPDDGGSLGPLRDAINRVVDRLSGAQVQQSRGGDVAYQFLQAPVGATEGYRHAHLHVFLERRRAGADAEYGQAMVAFDVATTRLGPLWITLSTVRNSCVCTFRSESAQVLDAIRQDAAELEASFRTVGFAGAEVRTAPWHGDRLRELADLMTRLSGLEVNA